MRDNKNLLPCPFCGGEVSVVEMGDSGANWYGIIKGTGENPCKCRIFMESEIFFDDNSQAVKDNIKKSLIEAWNRRTCSSKK